MLYADEKLHRKRIICEKCKRYFVSFFSFQMFFVFMDFVPYEILRVLFQLFLWSWFLNHHKSQKNIRLQEIKLQTVSIYMCNIHWQHIYDRKKNVFIWWEIRSWYKISSWNSKAILSFIAIHCNWHAKLLHWVFAV